MYEKCMDLRSDFEPFLTQKFPWSECRDGLVAGQSDKNRRVVKEQYQYPTFLAKSGTWNKAAVVVGVTAATATVSYGMKSLGPYG